MDLSLVLRQSRFACWWGTRNLRPRERTSIVESCATWMMEQVVAGPIGLGDILLADCFAAEFGTKAKLEFSAYCESIETYRRKVGGWSALMKLQRKVTP